MPTLSDLRSARIEKYHALREKGINPHPPVVNRDRMIAAAASSGGQTVSVAGRVMAVRGHGKIVFADLRDESGSIQAVFKNDRLPADIFGLLEYIDIGDFLSVTGEVGKTQAGEVSVFVTDFQIASKSLRPLPDQWYGFRDTEERYRKRYIDMLLNPDVKKVLDARWTIEKAIRTYLWGEGYKEVETPVMQPLYGGTNARPFTTHMNALDTDYYLRVAPELYLKRLIVGGYERVFEIARNFRNEGIDLTHQPEFTMMEFYEAYADYQRIMDLTESLFRYVANAVNQSYTITIDSHSVDLEKKWRRITVDEALFEHTGIVWDEIPDGEIDRKLKEQDIRVPGVFTRNKALFTLYDHIVTPKLIDPTWVTDYPREVSPLSKEHRSKPDRVERFEGYMGGKEICDGWSEIVSGLEQRQRFESEQKNLRAGDAEAQPLDEDFITALEYGCPPLGGIGIGIDRMTMLLTNTWAIREVIAFPTLKPERKTEVQVIEKPEYLMVSKDLKAVFPSVSIGAAIIRGVRVSKTDPGLEQEKEALIKSYSGLTTEQIGEFPEIQSYRKLYKATGVDWHSRRPSPEALLRRIALGKGLYTINTCVDAYNLIVMREHVSAGAFDLSGLAFPTVLRFAKAGEEILLHGDEKPTAFKEGEFLYADAHGPYNMDFNYRDARHALVTEETTDVFINVDGIFAVTPERVQEVLDKAVKIITTYCGGTVEFKGVVL